VSIDPPERQCSFAQKTGVTFPLIADSDRRISELYGAARPLLPLDKRITYLIDPNGVVRFRFQHQFQISQHLDNVVGTLRELVEQVPAEKRIFTPKAS
jgi:peroxiredoxin Q/BCP